MHACYTEKMLRCFLLAPLASPCVRSKRYSQISCIIIHSRGRGRQRKVIMTQYRSLFDRSSVIWISDGRVQQQAWAFGIITLYQSIPHAALCAAILMTDSPAIRQHRSHPAETCATQRINFEHGTRFVNRIADSIEVQQ